MAKAKAETKVETVTKAFVGDTEFNNPESASEWRDTTPNPDVPAAPDNVFYRVERGKLDNGKAAYRVYMKAGPEGEAIMGDILGSVPAAFNNALQSMGIAKGAVTGETNLRALFPPQKGDNNPPEEVLSDDDLKHADQLIAELDTALQERDAAEVKTREAELKTANVVMSIRNEFATKKRWGALKAERLEKAPANVAALLKNNNAVGYYGKFASAAQHSEFWNAIPDNIRTPRTFEKELGIMLQTIARAIVTEIREEKKVTVDGKKVWAFGDKLTKKTLTEAASMLLADYAEHGIDVKEGFEDAAKALCKVHADNWNTSDIELFTEEKVDGVARIIPTKGDNVPGAVFGVEGADEMVNAVCKAANNYEAAKSVEIASGEDSAKGVAALSKAIKAGNAFSDMSVDDAARHLLHILAGKLDDENREASADEAMAIVDAMSLKLEGFRDGSLDKADVYASPDEVPESEEGAEDEADAA